MSMSLFGNILQKLGFSKPDEKAASGAGPQTPPKAAPPHPADPLRAASRGEPGRSAKPQPISEVDVVSKLEGLAAANPQELNWKVSIVDLLKLLDLDSSYEARKELAVELGCPADKMEDSAVMNTWLHRTVMRKLAYNGGNIPKELLD
jgi:hypothetical protein